MSVERVVDCTCDLGEGPVWHTGEDRLYWVDIDAGRLHRFDPATGTHDVAFETRVVSGVTVQRDGSLLLFMDRGRVGHLVDGELVTVEQVVEQDEESRFNDVIADPAGRVFCGTMPTDARGGRLHHLDTDGATTLVADGVGIPNGMGFTRNYESCYFTETEADTIYRYAYDERTGELSARERFVTTSDTPGLPDGMTVDAAGGVWSARWKGGCVVRYDASGTEVDRVDLPAEKVTSVAFGGPGLGRLYVTTGGGSARPEEGTGAGALFRLDPDVAGRPECRSAVDF
ncbi:gluconolaconase [Salinigranum rubrum]|uniref:Gluconolaconase n=1 Tax=Salinigranum rubrum TaxID=755307 RepID=A0A2I8VF07_9EURY|nr:SMP-30/gluconolactonase/LRE family protein [Salinigranum rubrum]AUV80454.1 gluconolaconase [Salinigranum rubrum]